MLVFARQDSDQDTNPAHVLAVMNAMLFSYLPISLFGLQLSIAVKKKSELFGICFEFML